MKLPEEKTIWFNKFFPVEPYVVTRATKRNVLYKCNGRAGDMGLGVWDDNMMTFEERMKHEDY